MKWYLKLFIVLLCIVFSPIILLFLTIAFSTYLIQLPALRKQYKNSAYYKAIGLPFATYRVYSAEFRFYNSMIKRNLQGTFVCQKSNNLQYFVYDNTLFLFPDFDHIDYVEELEEWQVDFDADWQSFDPAYKDLVSRLDADSPSLPIKILVERKMFTKTDLNDVSIPECIFLTWNYETCFENEDSPHKLVIPTNSQELYDMMRMTPKLCGQYKITEKGNIEWDLYENVRIDISVNPDDCYLGVIKIALGKTSDGITHWHPSNYEIYNEICKIGRQGNVLVIRSNYHSSKVLYMGDEANCPYKPDEKTMSGKMYYLKAN